MLGRYQIVRGKRPPGNPIPDGLRQDTRKHTKHVLRPDTEQVTEFLADPTDVAWRRFAKSYRARLAERFKTDRAAFDRIAAAAREGAVWLGCNCPTAKNPDVRRCHTSLALEFMEQRFRDLEIAWPKL